MANEIYKFSSFRDDVEITKLPIVKETEKCYFTSVQRILKDSLDLLNDYGYMYSLSDDPTNFINQNLSYLKSKKKRLLEEVNRCEQRISKFENMIGE